MNCAAVRDRFSELMDGELDAAARQSLEGHLEGCAGCRAAWASFRGVVDAVRGLPMRTAPAGFAEEIRQRLEREQLLKASGPAVPGVRRWGPARWYKLAAAAALVLVAVKIVTPPKPRAPEGVSYKARSEAEGYVTALEPSSKGRLLQGAQDAGSANALPEEQVLMLAGKESGDDVQANKSDVPSDAQPEGSPVPSPRPPEAPPLAEPMPELPEPKEALKSFQEPVGALDEMKDFKELRRADVQAPAVAWVLATRDPWTDASRVLQASRMEVAWAPPEANAVRAQEETSQDRDVLPKKVAEAETEERARSLRKAPGGAASGPGKVTLRVRRSELPELARRLADLGARPDGKGGGGSAFRERESRAEEAGRTAAPAAAEAPEAAAREGELVKKLEALEKRAGTFQEQAEADWVEVTVSFESP